MIAVSTRAGDSALEIRSFDGIGVTRQQENTRGALIPFLEGMSQAVAAADGY